MKVCPDLDESFSDWVKPSLSLKELRLLREFYMAQQALSRELQAAKPLGICKTTMSTNDPTTVIKFSKKDSKETSS